jgi:hypothetical protein
MSETFSRKVAFTKVSAFVLVLCLGILICFVSGNIGGQELQTINASSNESSRFKTLLSDKEIKKQKGFLNLVIEFNVNLEPTYLFSRLHCRYLRIIPVRSCKQRPNLSTLSKYELIFFAQYLEKFSRVTIFWLFQATSFTLSIQSQASPTAL